jgi:hypothetical protein
MVWPDDAVIRVYDATGNAIKPHELIRVPQTHSAFDQRAQRSVDRRRGARQ